MRNQAWTPGGTLVNDIEIYRDGGKIKVRDHLLNKIRDADADEQIALLNEETSLIPPRDLATEVTTQKAEIDELRADIKELKKR